MRINLTLASILIVAAMMVVSVAEARDASAYTNADDSTGVQIETDYESDGIIRMHLPTTMFAPLIDVLRNESGIYVYMAQGRAFLGTAKEPIGEGE